MQGDIGTDWRSSGDAIADGAWIEIRGQADRSGAGVIAARVELKSAGNARPELQAVATAFDAAAGTVTLLGQTVASDAGTEFHGHSSVSGVDGPALAKADFFAGLASGLSVVKATGQGSADWSAGPTGTARSLELEGER